GQTVQSGLPFSSSTVNALESSRERTGSASSLGGGVSSTLTVSLSAAAAGTASARKTAAARGRVMKRLPEGWSAGVPCRRAGGGDGLGGQVARLGREERHQGGPLVRGRVLVHDDDRLAGGRLPQAERLAGGDDRHDAQAVKPGAADGAGGDLPGEHGVLAGQP